MEPAAPPNPLIATFAPELIDRILHHLLILVAQSRSTRLYDDSQRRGVTPPTQGLLALKAVSCICRSWAAPARRLILRRLVVDRHSQAAGLLDETFDNGGWGSAVKHLTIEWKREVVTPQVGGGQDVTSEAISADQLTRLLQLLPSLQSLKLDGPPLDYTIPDNIGSLERIESLTIISSARSSYQLAHDLVSRTPNLHTLTMADNRRSSSEKNTSKSHFIHTQRQPIHLSNLLTLRLIGGYGVNLVEQNLLAPSSFSKVSTLHWDSTNTRAIAKYTDIIVRPSPKLFTLVAPSLRHLSYTPAGKDPNVTLNLLKCTTLTYLAIDGGLGYEWPPLLPCLPATLRVLKIGHVWLAGKILGGREPLPESLSKVLVFDGPGWKEEADLMVVRLRCKAANVELERASKVLTVADRDIS
ncbi:hypothetical protein RQP46_008931 [Phenoliferia psychrophenolica]